MSQTKTLAQTPPFAELAQVLRDTVGQQTAIFLVNDGNWGDSLIREGAEKFLTFHGIRYVSLRFKDLEKGKITVDALKARHGADSPLIFNGGAALDPRYGRLPFVAALTHQFAQTVLLPASFPVPLAPFNFAPRTRIFSRDLSESQTNVPQATFCHDMAFYLTMPDIAPSRDNGCFMRTDSERPTDAPVPANNNDLSLKGRAETPVQGFIAEIARYRTVYTNRLHIGICAALLGRQVYLSGNDYYKIRAIYDASIAPNFDRVVFGQTFDMPPEFFRPQPKGLWQRLGFGRA